MINLLKTNQLNHFILINKLTKIREVLTYSELQNRIKKNRKDFFNTYRIETVNKKSNIEKILLVLFYGVFALAMGSIILETITQIF
jgi:hypothetical protein